MKTKIKSCLLNILFFNIFFSKNNSFYDLKRCNINFAERTMHFDGHLGSQRVPKRRKTKQTEDIFWKSILAHKIF